MLKLLKMFNEQWWVELLPGHKPDGSNRDHKRPTVTKTTGDEVNVLLHLISRTG